MDVQKVALEGTVTPNGAEFTFVDVRLRVQGDWSTAMAAVAAIELLETSDGAAEHAEEQEDEVEAEAPAKGRRRGKVRASSEDEKPTPEPNGHRAKAAEPVEEVEEEEAEKEDDEEPAPKRPRRRAKAAEPVKEVEESSTRRRGRRKTSGPSKEDVAKAASAGAEELSAEAMGEIIAEYSDSHKIDDIPEERRKEFIDAVEHELSVDDEEDED